MGQKIVAKNVSETQKFAVKIGERILFSYARGYRLGFLNVALSLSKEEKEKMKTEFFAEEILRRYLEEGEDAEKIVRDFEAFQEPEETAEKKTEKEVEVVFSALHKMTEKYTEKGLVCGRTDGEKWKKEKKMESQKETKEENKIVAEQAMSAAFAKHTVELVIGRELYDSELVLPPKNISRLMDVPPRTVLLYMDPKIHRRMCRLCKLNDWYADRAVEYLEMIAAEK